jgi:hypothetical protein
MHQYDVVKGGGVIRISSFVAPSSVFGTNNVAVRQLFVASR